MDGAEIIRLLNLEPHLEGGHFRETFRDARRWMAGRHRPLSVSCCGEASACIGTASTLPGLALLCRCVTGLTIAGVKGSYRFLLKQ
jgi:hypothetical protein